MQCKTGIKRFFLFVICFLFGRLAAQGQEAILSHAEKHGKIAILIDDFGYCGEGTEQMLSLPIPFTAAVMPFSKSTQSDAEAIRKAGKEIFIHLPMESLTGKKEWVGEKGVFLDMESAEIRKCTEEAFAALPDAKGLNNHMGSAIMADETALLAVFEVLQEKQVGFVDSMTTANSLGKTLAFQKGISFYGRDVFLDSTNSLEEIKKNLRKTAQIAMQKGEALAIGHVGPEGGRKTAQAIQEMIPELEQTGITFVTVSELFK